VKVDPAVHTAADVGDEPLLLAAAATTWVSANRPAGAKAAIAAGAGIIVMDDGHQNPTLHKDLSLIVMDTDYGVGNGRVIPAGPLREPVAEGMRRADAVISVGPVAGGTEDGRVRTTGTGKPLLRARIDPGPEVYTFSDQGVVAFAGIGRPEKFFETLRQAGAHLVAAYPFADHHVYTPEEIMRLVEEAAHHGAKLVTTEKDAVRLPPEARLMVETLSVTLEFADPGALAHLLAPLTARALRDTGPP
jgi:tetraacyldisaccharide 4'-kinase